MPGPQIGNEISITALPIADKNDTGTGELERKDKIELEMWYNGCVSLGL
jgi:hypothetical protein